MGKRKEMREQRKKDQRRNRFIFIAIITAGALLFGYFLINQNLNSANPGTVNTPSTTTPKTQVGQTSLGDPNAPVKMDVWEDFQCSGCLAYSLKLEPQILQTFVDTGKVFYTYHFYPFIDGGQGESHDAANAAMCASAQNKFWDYHDMLFANWLGENAGSYTKARLQDFATRVGLDMTAFENCFKENTYSDYIQKDVDAGTKLGVPPTPGIFINGQMVVSSKGQAYIPSFDDISLAIQSAAGSQ